MKHLALILTVLVLNIANFANAKDACWQKEVDVSTGDRFASEAAYKAALADWKDNEPPHPSLLELFFGSIVADSAKAKAERMGSDERAHCFVGCRVAKLVDLETAVYAGWYKEKKDLTDCKSDSFFDHTDFDITLIGAELGAQKRACYKRCMRLFSAE